MKLRLRQAGIGDNDTEMVHTVVVRHDCQGVEVGPRGDVMGRSWR
jgi:hypothetical protein